MLRKMHALVKSQSHLVLATSGSAGPHASLMAFAADPEATQFWLATFRDTQKFRNITADPRVSLLLDDRTGAAGERAALTVTAERAPFASPEAEAAARDALRARHPDLAAFLSRPDAVLVRLVARRFEFVCGLADVMTWNVEKKG